MNIAMKTTTYDPIVTILFIGMGAAARLEAFEWLQKDPKIMKALNVIGRLMDDMTTHKVRMYGNLKSNSEKKIG